MVKIIPSGKELGGLSITGVTMDALKGGIAIGIGSMFGPIGTFAGAIAGAKIASNKNMKILILGGTTIALVASVLGLGGVSGATGGRQ